MSTSAQSGVRNIAVVGGGISGLATAYYLEKARQAGASLKYTLYEASERLGGILGTERQSSFLIETGADSWISQKPWAEELAKEIGLKDQLIPSLDEQRRTYILVNSRLVQIPQGMQLVTPTRLSAALRSPLFSAGTKLRIVRERFMAPTRSTVSGDESVSSFVERHFGREMVERIAEPLLAGVFGGDASKLSAKAVLPTLVAMEQSYGSLIRGSVATQKATEGGKSSSSLFTSLRSGMQRLPSAIAERIPASSIVRGARITKLEKTSTGWQIWNRDEAIRCDELVLAIPAPAAGRLLAPFLPQLSAALALHYSSCIVVALGFDSTESKKLDLPPGFGFLVPRKEKRLLMACTFVHRKFGHRAYDGCALLRAFIGEPAYDAVKSDYDTMIAQKVREELQSILGFNAEPSTVHVQRWPLSMPQYEVGHLDRMNTVQTILTEIPDLHLAGNAYQGVGVPDCVRSGKLAAERIVGKLALTK